MTQAPETIEVGTKLYFRYTRTFKHYNQVRDEMEDLFSAGEISMADDPVIAHRALYIRLGR